MSFVHFRGIEHIYRDRDQPALQDIDLTWEEGESLAVVGGSGAGKSTLFRLLIGARFATRGAIHFRGHPLFDQKLRDRRRLNEFRCAIQPLFQHPSQSLNPRMTLGESVEEGARRLRKLSGEPLRTRRREAFETLSLDEGLADRFPHEVSGGERQRAALARALAVDPEALALDEPTASLDAMRRKELCFELRRQKEKGRGLFLVTHDLGLARALADRVAVLSQGRLVECRPTCDLYAEPAHPYTKALLRASGLASEKGKA